MSALPISRAVLILVAALLPACESSAPRSNLRLAPVRETGFNREADGRLHADLGGVALFVDFGKQDTRIELTVENRGPKKVDLRAGADGATTTAAIGEVWCRPIGASHGEDVADAQPYRANEPISLQAGWRAVFFLDSPLGRDIMLGTQMQFTVETRDPDSGLHEHATLPLIATNVPPEGIAR